MTLDKYVEMCKQMGDEIDWEKAPPIWEDFPDYVHYAVDVFNCLPDTYSSGMEPIYTGKDLSAYSVIAKDIFELDSLNFKRVFELVMFMDSRAREKAIKAAKKKGGKK